jgi:hypothetical protein
VQTPFDPFVEVVVDESVAFGVREYFADPGCLLGLSRRHRRLGRRFLVCPDKVLSVEDAAEPVAYADARRAA